MRKTAAFLLTLCVATSASAGAPEANFTGPLVTPNASALPAGVAVVEPYLIYTESHASYDTDGDRHTDHPGAHQWLLLAPFTIGITDRLNGQLVTGTAYNVSGKSHSDGVRLTDTSVMLQYMFVAPHEDGSGPAFSASYTHIFPTGAYHHLDNNPLNSTGDGASANRLAVFTQQLFWLQNNHPLRLRALLAWGPSPSTIHVEGASSHGTTAGFHGSAAMGTSLGVSASFEYGLDAHWVLATDLTWDHRNGTTLRGSQCLPSGTCASLDQRKPPHWSYGIAPAVEYNFNARVGLIVGAQISFAGHNSPSYWAPQAALNMAF